MEIGSDSALRGHRAILWRLVPGLGKWKCVRGNVNGVGAAASNSARYLVLIRIPELDKRKWILVRSEMKVTAVLSAKNLGLSFVSAPY